MSDKTTAPPGATPVDDPNYLWTNLEPRMIKLSEVERQQLNVHVRIVTDDRYYDPLSLYMSSEDAGLKVGALRECLLAIVTKDYSKLKGKLAVGQADKVEPVKAPAPASRDALADQAMAAAAAKTKVVVKNRAASPAPDMASVVTAAVTAALGAMPQQTGVDPDEVAGMCRDILASELKIMGNELRSKLDADFKAAVAKLPPRDVVEIRTADQVREVKGIVHRQYGELLKMLAARNELGWSEFIYCYGAPGAGKTHLLRQLAEGLGVQHHPFPCGPTSTEGKLLGFNNLATGTFIRGWLYTAYKDGGLVGLDEIDLADAGVLAGCNSIENDEFTFGNGDRVKRHRDFYLIAFANTLGTGATGGFQRNKLDAATLNRFTHYKLEYDRDMETKLFGNAKWAQWVHKVRDYVEKNCQQSVYITPRAVRKGAAYLKAGFNWRQVADWTVFGLIQGDLKETIIKNVGDFKP